MHTPTDDFAPQPRIVTASTLAAIVADRTRAAAAVAAGILAIALLDFVSGTEIRIFPLYYAPIALAAWTLGRNAALGAATVCALCWLISNQLAGQHYSHPVIWVINTVVQGASFAIIATLVTHLRAILARERALSRTDGLTGLMNHRAFYEASERVLRLSRRTGRPVTLAYLDLDDFKLVNDTLGHLRGDELLRDVALVLQSTLRSTDLTARLGGDEFAVLLPDLGADQAEQALRRLHTAINHAARAGASPISVTIGAVTVAAPRDDVEPLVRLADAALYVAKAAGKNRVNVQVAESDG